MCTGGCGLSTDKQYDAGVPMVIRAVSQAEGEFLKDEDTNDIITSEDELFTPSSLKLGEISIEEQGCYYGLFQYDVSEEVVAGVECGANGRFSRMFFHF